MLESSLYFVFSGTRIIHVTTEKKVAEKWVEDYPDFSIYEEMNPVFLEEGDLLLSFPAIPGTCFSSAGLGKDGFKELFIYVSWDYSCHWGWSEEEAREKAHYQSLLWDI